MTNKEVLFKDDAKLVTAIFGNACYRCAYKKGNDTCHRPDDNSCLDGILEWLNGENNDICELKGEN